MKIRWKVIHNGYNVTPGEVSDLPDADAKKQIKAGNAEAFSEAAQTGELPPSDRDRKGQRDGNGR